MVLGPFDSGNRLRASDMMYTFFNATQWLSGTAIDLFMPHG